MSWFRLAVLYVALAFGANTAAADTAALEALREGDMKKLSFHEAPREVSQAEFTDAEGGTHTLADFRGKHVVLNFWATWCAPCRKEMPTLDALEAEFGSEDFQVVIVATGRNSLTGIRKFFDEVGVENLTIYLDPKQQLAREMSVLGLPITMILNPEGQEIARAMGDADWHSDSARAIIGALTAGS
ncbi:thioredoxin [Maritimibacter sp. 55A14]|uniref:TlpA family protein disulfide reductase n=1 Tax=Maritimibacter sp. 55A14 TaxID=2174844 RepID=UPI000D60EE95|nr:TlpA disulfide reductase family protein [Maritimibacter sp. 55A14]PWE32475.1 thioredoxin [Maritimibacter sp. 55A14]